MGSTKTVLYDYQKRWLQDDSRFKVAMFSRQSGKTFTTLHYQVAQGMNFLPVISAVPQGYFHLS
ncbi:hypothetical protein [Actinobacillus minor]|uniref:hypothetical protein n=1 Tax=Actinobacillus minor TaxID=51047 RepID=UPI0026F2EFDA|nr:hypothetical protein [Actinobacillus minor]